MIRTIISRVKGLSGEAVRYIIIGALTTLLNLAVFTLLTRKTDIDVTVCNVTSISVSILFAYVTNKLIVFNNHCATSFGLILEFVKFVGSRLFTMALEVGVVLLFTGVLKRDEMIGKLVAQVLVVVANYIISKLIVFRNNKTVH